ncbi:hypothetical protein D3C84_849190 [compost metagenome]
MDGRDVCKFQPVEFDGRDSLCSHRSLCAQGFGAARAFYDLVADGHATASAVVRDLLWSCASGYRYSRTGGWHHWSEFALCRLQRRRHSCRRGVGRPGAG